VTLSAALVDAVLELAHALDDDTIGAVKAALVRPLSRADDGSLSCDFDIALRPA